jgi:Ca2+-binding EF-hand superfamily protein
MIDLVTFTRIAGSMIAQREKALKAFGLFDKDGMGLICLEDLRRVAEEWENPGQMSNCKKCGLKSMVRHSLEHPREECPLLATSMVLSLDSSSIQHTIS